MNWKHAERAYALALAAQQPDPGPQENDKNAKEMAALWLPTAEQHNAPRRVLDVGSGNGYARPIFETRGWQYTAIDLFSPDALHLDIHGDDMPERYGLVWSTHMLEHSPFPLLALVRMRDALEAHGWAIISVPLPPGASSCSEHVSCLDRCTWRRLMQLAGFIVWGERAVLYGTDGWWEAQFLLRRDT